MQGGQWNGRRRRTRFRHFRRERIALLIVSAALIVFGLVKLIGYGADLAASRQTAADLREAYREQTKTPVAETPVPAPILTASTVPSPTVKQARTVRTAAVPTLEPAPRLVPVSYPNNPDLQVNSRFRMLRQQNKDIAGWLTISGLLDEPVVQRDEVFYMDHDALGKKNVNGAIFLDSGISLKKRPCTLILYGHNMKTGAMFGCLRNYENISFYHKNPFITFDTKYEEGRYVIFAAGSIRTEPPYTRSNYIDFFYLTSDRVNERETALKVLKTASVHTCTVDVQLEDQLLLLITCVDNDAERRVIAARRVRDGENEQDLKKQVERSRKRY